jgi:hypothetical protein
VESYINAYSDFVRPYNEADEVGKLNIIEDFIKFLSGKRADYIVDFEVTGEEVLKDRNIAYVEAKVRRFGARYPFVYSYRYTLEKYRDFWLVIDVDATVMKGEKP